MPMGTLELPRSMIDAAETYAERENLSVADLFADLLHSRYGYSITLTVSRPQAPVRRKRFSLFAQQAKLRVLFPT